MTAFTERPFQGREWAKKWGRSVFKSGLVAACPSPPSLTTTRGFLACGLRPSGRAGRESRSCRPFCYDENFEKPRNLPGFLGHVGAGASWHHAFARDRPQRPLPHAGLRRRPGLARLLSAPCCQQTRGAGGSPPRGARQPEHRASCPVCEAEAGSHRRWVSLECSHVEKD